MVAAVVFRMMVGEWWCRVRAHHWEWPRLAYRRGLITKPERATWMVSGKQYPFRRTRRALRVWQAKADLVRRDREDARRWRRWLRAWDLLARELPPRLWCLDCEHLVHPAINHHGGLFCEQCRSAEVMAVR